MRLLIVAQAVDHRDPVLGFFHGWIRECASRFESISVICLYEGAHSLPGNVRVFSLGKEKGRASPLTYSLRFLSRIWKLRCEYDAVLVHMNQEYVLLGGLFWKLWGKHVYLWRNHYAGSSLTALAVALCTKVFCTSAHSYTARFKKTVLMPVGIDTEVFKEMPSVTRMPGSILSLGRIAPSKKLEVLLEALKIVRERGVSFRADIYGNALPQDVAYLENLKERVRDTGLETFVIFRGAISNHETPPVYAAHELFINTSHSGMYDKTIFEAAACGSTVLAASEDFAQETSPRFSYDGSAQDLAAKIEALLVMPADEKATSQEMFRSLVARNSLTQLSSRLTEEIR